MCFGGIETTSDWSEFVNAWSDEHWVVTGTSPISGEYQSKKDWYENVMQPLFAVPKGPVGVRLKQVIAEGETVVVLWESKATSKKRHPIRSGILLGDGNEGQENNPVKGILRYAPGHECSFRREVLLSVSMQLSNQILS